jgi:translation initiation factor 4G
METEEAKRLREDALRKEQEKKDAEERAKKETEEKKKRDEEEEAERKRKAEEDRIRKEEEERERIRQDEEEKENERLRREEEERLEAQRKDEEEKARIIREEEEQKQKDTLEAEEAQLEADEADDIVETTSPVSEPQDTEDGEVLDTDELPEPEPQLNGDSGKKAKEALRIVTSSMPPPSELPRRRPDPLDLASAKRDVSAPPPSALVTARVIENLSEVEYPEGIKSPQVELNANSKDGRFRFADLLL